MDFRISALSLLLFLESTKSFSTERSSTIILNKISFNNMTTLHDNFQLGNTRNKKKISSSSTNSIDKSNRKWKIRRVANKQFEIINILWQKTKIFVDRDYSNLTCKATTIEMTPNIQKQTDNGASKLTVYQGKIHSSTHSYIEFYYLDQADERIKRKHPSNAKIQKLKKDNKTNVDRFGNKKSPNPSLFKIHTNTNRRKNTPQLTKSIHKIGQRNLYRNKLNKSKRTTSVSKLLLTVTTETKNRNYQQPKKLPARQSILTFTKSTPVNSKTTRHKRKDLKTKNDSDITLNTSYNIKSYLVPVSTSTAYDRVKFFEMYDNNTPRMQHYITISLSNNMTFNKTKQINDRNNDQLLLHHINENIGHHHQDKNKTRYVKKHIQDLYSEEGTSKNKRNFSKYVSNHDLKCISSTSQFQVPSQKNFNFSRQIAWTEFPFVAVYIHEPSQVRCDAAGISPHWLLAAASCLSRHRKALLDVGLSAFVTFCGDNWRYPQMISYVRRTLIHPVYHPKDRLRHLFNAGLIQVVNSMADTCSGWEPASLMSHQYTTDEKGSIGMAVGWGLDRYDESYNAINIPSHPLMVYEARFYSQRCPGSLEYGQGKSFGEDGVTNVYCLLLPPYLAEENDTVHGALLLNEGKLLALYLKEERRPWGVQSALYTSIWRLLPWLVETAREPDESFQFEI